MHLPQQISHPFHHEQHDAATGTGELNDATGPVPARPRERRKSKFLEEGMFDETKLELRSGEDASTFDSVVSRPAHTSPHVAKQQRAELSSEDSKWKRRDPFGEVEGSGEQHKFMTWWQAALVMAAEIISIGIFFLPSALDVLGIVPGIILIVGFGVVSTYTGHVLWRFRMAYPFVQNMSDVGELLGGRLVREAMGVAQLIFLVFTMGRHILFFNTSFNKITNHATCTIAWAVLAFAISFIISTPRTLRTLSYISIISLLSILATALITMIDIGRSRPHNTHIKITNHTSLATAFLSVSSIIFSYSAHITFFTIISELRQPRDFPKALFASQASATALYVVVAVAIYSCTNAKITSAAIENTGPTIQKIAHGIALPSIVVTAVIYAHVAAKSIYARLLLRRPSKHAAAAAAGSGSGSGSDTTTIKTARALTSWLLIVLALWTAAFVIAESIPGYGYLFGLICSIFTSWFTYGLAGILWLFLHGGVRRHQFVWAVVNVVIVLVALGMMGMGLYSSGKAMHEDDETGSWSCADTAAAGW